VDHTQASGVSRQSYRPFAPHLAGIAIYAAGVAALAAVFGARVPRTGLQNL